MKPAGASQSVQTEETHVMQPLLLAGQRGIGSQVPLELKKSSAVQIQTVDTGLIIKSWEPSQIQSPFMSITKLVASEQLVQTVAEEHK